MGVKDVCFGYRGANRPISSASPRRKITIESERQENIGARRLYTVMERLLEDVSFHASKHEGTTIAVDAAFVDQRLAGIAGDDELAKYIL